MKRSSIVSPNFIKPVHKIPQSGTVEDIQVINDDLFFAGGSSLYCYINNKEKLSLFLRGEVHSIDLQNGNLAVAADNSLYVISSDFGFLMLDSVNLFENDDNDNLHEVDGGRLASLVRWWNDFIFVESSGTHLYKLNESSKLDFVNSYTFVLKDVLPLGKNQACLVTDNNFFLVNMKNGTCQLKKITTNLELFQGQILNISSIRRNSISWILGINYFSGEYKIIDLNIENRKLSLLKEFQLKYHTENGLPSSVYLAKFDDGYSLFIPNRILILDRKFKIKKIITIIEDTIDSYMLINSVAFQGDNLLVGVKEVTGEEKTDSILKFSLSELGG